MSEIEIANIMRELKGIREDTKEIKAEAKKTNGRVSSLEIWQAYVKGGLAVSSWAIPVITAVATALAVALVNYLLK
jgi:hypothetical protein